MQDTFLLTKSCESRQIHHLMVHIRHEIKIVPLRSANAEQTERSFNQLNEIAKSATNRQVTNIIPNLLIRLQAVNEKQSHPHMQAMSPELPKQKESFPHSVQPNSNSALSRHERVAIKPTWRVAVSSFSQALESGEERKEPERVPESSTAMVQTIQMNLQKTPKLLTSGTLQFLPNLQGLKRYGEVIDSKIESPLATVQNYDENDDLKEIVSYEVQGHSDEDQGLEVNADVLQLVRTPLEKCNDDNMDQNPLTTVASTDQVASTNSSVSEPDKHQWLNQF